MSGFLCTEHPERPAVFSCDGCARLLCGDCTKAGHRLIFCLLCGERALPLDAATPASVPERQRHEKKQRRYTFDEALRYVFRGNGRLLFPVYVTGMTVADVVPFFGGAVGWLFRVMLPAMLFAIVNTTADGEDSLPDWPDYTDPFDRIREMFWMLLIFAVSCLPTVFFFRVLDCDIQLFLIGQGGGSCWLALVAGAVLGAVVGVLAFGATAYYSSGWLSFRIDLHLRTLLTGARGDIFRTAGVVSLLFVVSQVVAMALRPLPIAGAAAEHALSGYALFTGAHLVGLVFRRHSDLLDPIYRD